MEDEILGEYSVLVENDREPGGRNRVPVPIVENAEVQQQYISLESSGDVVEEVLDSMSNVVALNRQQEQWEQLTAVIGERVLKAFVVQGDVGQARRRRMDVVGVLTHQHVSTATIRRSNLRALCTRRPPDGSPCPVPRREGAARG